MCGGWHESQQKRFRCFHKLESPKPPVWIARFRLSSRLRLSDSYNVAQMKRVLLKGIEELQSKWDLRTLPNIRQFEKRGKGNLARPI